jgi:hypothetical protein
VPIVGAISERNQAVHEAAPFPKLSSGQEGVSLNLPSKSNNLVERVKFRQRGRLFDKCRAEALIAKDFTARILQERVLFWN